jgi:hypothetical protein
LAKTKFIKTPSKSTEYEIFLKISSKQEWESEGQLMLLLPRNFPVSEVDQSLANYVTFRNNFADTAIGCG